MLLLSMPSSRFLKDSPIISSAMSVSICLSIYLFLSILCLCISYVLGLVHVRFLLRDSIIMQHMSSSVFDERAAAFLPLLLTILSFYFTYKVRQIHVQDMN
jgi:hypothetical protein